MHVQIDGQVILVTGASRGIGAAVARQLAAAGANVAVHYHRRADLASALVRGLGGESKAFSANLEQPEAVLTLWQRVLGHYGRIDSVVNNAGVAIKSPLNGSDEAWLADWQRTMAVNTTATALLCRAATEHFRASGGGRVVNIASRAAFRGDEPEYLAYAASKAAIVSLTKSIARAYGQQGIRAFTIAPGFTRTDMASAFIERYGEAHAMIDIALERLTEPEDIAPSVVFLLSGLADHATGTTIDLNAASYLR